jgi:hypothetical protein
MGTGPVPGGGGVGCQKTEKGASSADVTSPKCCLMAADFAAAMRAARAGASLLSDFSSLATEPAVIAKRAGLDKLRANLSGAATHLFRRHASVQSHVRGSHLSSRALSGRVSGL